MSFTTTKLTNHRVLVSGTDVLGVNSTTVLDSTEWDCINAEREHLSAHTVFDREVESFYAPLVAATEALRAAGSSDVDDLFIEVLDEGTEAVPGSAGVRFHLSKDSALLKLLAANTTDRLVWVKDELEILEVVSTFAQPALFDAGFGADSTEFTA